MNSITQPLSFSISISFRREPLSLLKPEKKYKATESTIDLRSTGTSGDNFTEHSNVTATSTNATDDAKLESLKSKATRHIILVRHGQYNMEGSADNERILTKLGNPANHHYN